MASNYQFIIFSIKKGIIKVNGKMGKPMAMEYSRNQMVKHTKDNLLNFRNMVREYKHFQMEINMMETM